MASDVERDEIATARWAIAGPLEYVVQDPPSGTGDAVRVALDAISDDESGSVVVVPGDTPLLTAEPLRALLGSMRPGARGTRHAAHRATSATSTGYGRIVRAADGRAWNGSSRTRDATDEEQRVRRDQRGDLRVRRWPICARCIDKIDTENAQGEYYLTDVIELLLDGW